MPAWRAAWPRSSTASPRRSARRSTATGPGPTCRWTATTSFSSRCGSRSSTCSRPAAATRAARFRPRASPAAGTTATPSGTPRASCSPVLTFTAPDTVRHALEWRHSILDSARERAHQLGLRGAAMPWRTIRGEECSGYWPAGTAAFHVNAAVASAVHRYLGVTGDNEFEERAGCELLVESARLWASLGYHDERGDFRIDGVTGPDEYSALVDNNVYTNLMAQMNLRAAIDSVKRQPGAAERLGVTDEEVAEWRRAADAMFVPFDEERGLHPQDQDFLEHEPWDFREDPARPLPPPAQLPVLRALSPPGGEAGRPRPGDALARRRLHGQAEAGELRLLRGPHRARLLAVGVHPGRDGRGGGAHDPRARLPPRGRPHGRVRPRAQHGRRPAHGLAGRGGDRHRGRVRRVARLLQPPLIPAPPAARGSTACGLPCRSAAGCCASR